MLPHDDMAATQRPAPAALRPVSCANAPATAFGPIYHVTTGQDGQVVRTVQHPDGTKRELPPLTHTAKLGCG